MKINILNIQYKILQGKVQSNLTKIKRILKRYLHLKPDIIVLPEYALTGSMYGNYTNAFRINDKIIDKLKKLTQKFKVDMIPGSFLIKEENGKIFNTSLYIDKTGKIIHRYDKKILWSVEKKFLKKGERCNTFKTRFGTMAIQICADIHKISSLKTCTKNNKPKIIFNVSLWSYQDASTYKKYAPQQTVVDEAIILSRARAIENRSYFVFCNYGGSLKFKAKTGRAYQLTSIGTSMVIDPFGQVITRASTTNQEILFTQIDLTKTGYF